MITCFIRYEIDPFNVAAFEQYARNWGQAIPRCGADLIADLAAYEAYRARLRDDPIGRENFAFAKRERFIRKEDRIFLRLASAPHGVLMRP
jgi:hypothetical protein